MNQELTGVYDLCQNIQLTIQLIKTKLFLVEEKLDVNNLKQIKP